MTCVYDISRVRATPTGTATPQSQTDARPWLRPRLHTACAALARLRLSVRRSALACAAVACSHSLRTFRANVVLIFLRKQQDFERRNHRLSTHLEHRVKLLTHDLSAARVEVIETRRVEFEFLCVRKRREEPWKAIRLGDLFRVNHD